MPAHQMLLSCDSVLSSESSWTLSSKETKDAEATECACCSPTTKRRESHSPSYDDSSADTHSLSSNKSGSPEENDATDDEDVAVCLNEAHADAASMAEQSPIDICHSQCEVVPRPKSADSISITTGAGDAELRYSGRGFHVYWKGPVANTLTIAGKIYHAVQFHFHTPSEHTLDGDHEEMELHLVHQAADGSLAVVGIFFREGKQNPFLAQFWDELSGLNVGEANEIQLGMVDTKPLELLSGSFYRYRGSLTTPPYSEGVEWVVVRDIAQASREQLDAFRQVLPGTNARDVQPLNKRDVALVH